MSPHPQDMAPEAWKGTLPVWWGPMLACSSHSDSRGPAM